MTLTGRGNGPIDAFMDALKKQTGINLKVIDHREHSVGLGSDAPPPSPISKPSSPTGVRSTASAWTPIS